MNIARKHCTTSRDTVSYYSPSFSMKNTIGMVQLPQRAFFLISERIPLPMQLTDGGFLIYSRLLSPKKFTSGILHDNNRPWSCQTLEKNPQYEDQEVKNDKQCTFEKPNIFPNISSHPEFVRKTSFYELVELMLKVKMTQCILKKSQSWALQMCKRFLLY